MQTILSKFLIAGLLPIGEDDDKLKLLESAAEELAKQIKSTPLLTHRFAMVAMDEKVPASDPVHKLTEEIVFAKWQTITNKIGPNPVAVYRAVILRAIQIAACENPNLAFAVTLIAANRPVGIAGGKEQAAIHSMLAGFEETKMKELTDVWVNAVDLSLPKLSTRVKKPQINKEELAQGPEGVYNAIQTATKSFSEDMQEAVREAVQGLIIGVEKMAIRDAKSELLWIRTSLYSPFGRCSYRDLDTNDLILHAVLDTSRAVYNVAPPSVAFFLRELVSALSNKNASLVDTLAVIGPKLSDLPEAAILTKDTLGAIGRRGLLDCAIRLSGTESFEDQTGFKNGYEEAVPDLAVRLYRELQILKLLSPS
jgi:hypothetical protein